MGKSFEALAKDTKKFFALSGKKKAVLGVSGGVDSALTCAIAAKALGGKNVFCLHLPYYSDPTAKAHAETAARLFGAHFKVVSIRRMVDGIAGELKCDREGKGNVMARVRMVVLYDFARKENALVAGTGNKSELSLGYFSKYGDGGVDFLPIGGLLKKDVRKMALRAGIPRALVLQPATAGLWPGQTDEGEMQMLYSQLDEILELLERSQGAKAKAKFGAELVKRVEGMMKASRHKRLPPEIF